MSSSSNSQAPDYDIQFQNKYCRCGRRATIRISESQNNYSKLYFSCQERKCGFFQWWHPMNVHSVSDENIRKNGSEIKSLMIEMKTEVEAIRKHCKKIEYVVSLLKTMILAMFVVILVIVFNK